MDESEPLNIAELTEEITLALGFFKFVRAFAAVEADLYLAFATMIGDDGRDTEAILSHVDSISHKRDVIMAMARNRAGQNQAADALLSVENDIRELISSRNLLMHSLIGKMEDGSYLLVGNSHRLGRGPLKEVPLTPDLVAKKADLAMAIHKTLMANSRQGEDEGIRLRANWLPASQ